MARCGGTVGHDGAVRATNSASRTPALFLWDIDGTLLHGATRVHKDAFAHAYRTVYGLALSLDGIAAAGRTDTWLLAEPLRRLGVPDTHIWSLMPAAFQAMVTFVDERLGDLRGSVLAGVPEVLAALHAVGHLQALVTGNLMGIARAKLRHAALSQYFDVGGYGEESEVRAHLVPVAVRRAESAARVRIPPHRSVIIGDTPLDIEAGRLNGTRTCGVATGSTSPVDLRSAGADLVLPSLADHGTVVDGLLHLVAHSS